MRLRIGFIGIGAMGLSHLKALHQDAAGRAEAAALCSRSEENIRKAREIAPNVRVFRDERELIQSDLDAVVISSPNFTHAPLGLETIQARRHLFLEKPIGVTREECRQLLDAAAKTDRVVMIGHEMRYSPYFQKMKGLVDAGEIGRPRMVWTREFRGPFQPKSQNWIQDERKSGGMMVDKNCHHFDMMNWWVGARPRQVCAFGGNATYRTSEGRATRVPISTEEKSGTRAARPSEFGKHQVNDHATVSFEYDNGVLGTLHVCLFARDFPHEDLEMGIVGDRGMLQTRIATIEILQWQRGANQKEPAVHRVETKHGEGWGGHLGFTEIHEGFLNAALHGERPLTTVRDCLDGSLLAMAAEESIKKQSIVEIE